MTSSSTRSRAAALARRCMRLQSRNLATSVSQSNLVNIVEVGPRDGLQNEKGTVSVDTKVELIDRLSRAGLRYVEVGSFVSPKWVPQMAGTADVARRLPRHSNAQYAVLAPNTRGLADLLDLLQVPSPDSHADPPPPISEVAIFTAASDAFSRANTNCSVTESLQRLEKVAREALDNKLTVRGYVSVVDTCPYSGRTDPVKVREVSKALIDMGCYEVSLGDTVGTGTPGTIRSMLEEVAKDVPVDKLAGHFHDTYGTAIANVLEALSFGIRTIDAAVGGLGGCPYSPGATGNVATEDVIYALQGSQYGVKGGAKWEDIAEIGGWISGKLDRQTTSRVGRAYAARKERESRQREKDEKAKL